MVIGILTSYYIIFTGESKNKEGPPGPTPPALESLGSRLSLVAWVDSFRIDIVVSELREARGRARMTPDVDGGAAAFLCEKVSLDVDLRRVADVAVDELVQRRNVLYISRGQLKKHISTVLNFNLSVRFISQQVLTYPLVSLVGIRTKWVAVILSNVCTFRR